MTRVKKYYVVIVGRRRGVFSQWKNCRKHVEDFPNAEFRRFRSKEEAENFFFQHETTAKSFSDSSQGECSPRQPPQNHSVQIKLEQEESMSSSDEDCSAPKRPRLAPEDPTSSGAAGSIIQNHSIPPSTFDNNNTKMYSDEHQSQDIVGLKQELQLLQREQENLQNQIQALTSEMLEVEKKISLLQNKIEAASMNIQPETLTIQIEAPENESFCEQIKPHEVLSEDPDVDNNNFEVDEDGHCKIYTNGSFTDRNGLKRAGLGVWFGYHHKLNIGEPYIGEYISKEERHPLGCGQLQAEILALDIANAAGLRKVNIYSMAANAIKPLLEMVPTWQLNGWKNDKGKPVPHESQLKALLLAQEGLTVKWTYLKDGSIFGNRMSRRLARTGAKRYISP